MSNFKDVELKTLYMRVPDENGFVPARYDGKTYNGYLANKNGKIYSLKSKRFLQPAIGTAGYRVIELFDDGESKKTYVHKIIADSFIPITQDDVDNNRNMINHIDGNKLNNCIDNLERVNCLENNRHAHEHGLIPDKQKLYLSIKPHIIEDLKQGMMTYTEIENKYKDYGISITTIIEYAKQSNTHVKRNIMHDPKHKAFARYLAINKPNLNGEEIAKIINSKSDYPINYGTIKDWVRRARREQREGKI